MIEGASKPGIGAGSVGGDVERVKEGANYNTFWVSQSSRKIVIM